MARTGAYWDDNFCAEHDGRIASFTGLSTVLNDIENFSEIFKRDSVNYLKLGRTTALAAGSALMFVPGVNLAAPAFALAPAAMATAATGTAIGALSGAALASTSLAAIGGGGIGAGTAVVTATGEALGGRLGAAISSAYFGENEHFKIQKIRSGDKHAVIFVNGFLSEKEDDVEDWKSQLDPEFSANTWYHLDWEATSLRMLGTAAGAELARYFAVARGMAMSGGLRPTSIAAGLTKLARNPWHASMVKAQMAGVMLADAIARTPGWQFTLMGHSLGARVIYSSLMSLATKPSTPVRNVYLLGGAVGGGQKDEKDWHTAVKGVYGTIFNFYSERDSVLGNLYRGANAWQSRPAGFSPIQAEHAQIRNVDCSDLVDGHGAWKKNFAQLRDRLIF